MTRKNVNEFKLACKEYLSSYNVHALRPYGRELGVEHSTIKHKDVLMEDIVLILAGELAPVPRSKRGAPVKNDHVAPEIRAYISELCALYPMISNPASNEEDYQARLQKIKDNPFVLTANDPDFAENADVPVREVYRGQLQTFDGVSLLLSLKCMETEEKIVLPVELIRENALREGDVITCYAHKSNNALIATAILSINDLVAGSFRRGNFEEMEVEYPDSKWEFSNDQPSVTEKYLDWLLPIGKGQRATLIGAPKTGKSRFLLEIAQSLSRKKEKTKLFALLIDQPPEIIGQYKKYVQEENLIYSTYEEDTDRQVFTAEFLLKRAKRYAEMGNDVFLIVDSFNALARAYNESEESSGGKTLLGGIESKTIQYIKRYLGSARSFSKNGSLTIVGSIGIDTGNPADEIIKSELSLISNMEIYLKDELAQKRIYPAIDFIKAQGNNNEALFVENGYKLSLLIRNEYFSKFREETLLETLKESNDLKEFEEKIHEQFHK